MKKADRHKVFEKFGGRCAYCGCELKKGWHADHVENIHRKRKAVGGHYDQGTEDNPYGNGTWLNHKSIPDGCFYPENDILENINPSCQSCNHYKGTMDLGMFRKNIGLLVMRLNKSFNQYKIAKRYGLVQETNIPVLFYFETLNPDKQ